MCKQGTAVANFQYLIARLCSFLFHNLSEDLAKSFRTGLLHRQVELMLFCTHLTLNFCTLLTLLTILMEDSLML